MILVDTSAWIEFLRGTTHRVADAVDDLLQSGAEIVTTEPVVMEVLAGARSNRELEDLRVRLMSLPLLPVEGLADFEEAARIFRICRGAGETIRNQIDCLISIPAIRARAALLHNDADFDTIARHTDLVIHPLDGA